MFEVGYIPKELDKIHMQQKFCLKSRWNTESQNPKIAKKNKGNLMILSQCAVCDSKNIDIYQIVRSQWVIKWLRVKSIFKMN